MRAWWHDFEWSLRGVTVKQTGARVGFDTALAVDIARWLPYFCLERLRPSSRGFHVACLPQAPRPWYLLWASVIAGGGRFTSDLTKADIIAYFDDSTHSEPPALIDDTKPALNFGCTDISKSYVAQVFTDVFGYALSVDPLTYSGPMVVKGEDNGVHDGRIVQGPLDSTTPGCVYQYAVDTVDGRDVVDLRCPTVGGQIPLVYIKRRPEARRFDNMNGSVTLSTADAHFSADEQQKITKFCQAMGLDWGGLDILRDKISGKIFIVDVNKTDMGPPLALPLRDKLRSTRILGAALRDYARRDVSTPRPATIIASETV